MQTAKGDKLSGETRLESSVSQLIPTRMRGFVAIPAHAWAGKPAVGEEIANQFTLAASRRQLKSTTDKTMAHVTIVDCGGFERETVSVGIIISLR